MERDTKLVVMGGLKGGGGKTTMSNVFGKYICNYTDLKVKVIDGDIEQQNLYGVRLRDKEKYITAQKELGVKPDLAIAKFDEMSVFENPNYCMYEIEALKAAQVKKNYFPEMFGNYDIVLYDVPGNVEQPKIKDALALADCFFIPTSTADFNIESLITYIKNTLYPARDMRKTEGLPFLAYYYFNKINPRMNVTKDYLSVAGLDMEGIFKLKSYVTEQKVDFENNISSIDFSDIKTSTFKNFVDPLCKEMLSIINQL